MKRARLTRKVQGLIVLPGPFRTVEYPAGTVVLVLEALGPSHWLIETKHANDALEGGYEYETLEVEAEALEFLPEPFTPSSPGT